MHTPRHKQTWILGPGILALTAALAVHGSCTCESDDKTVARVVKHQGTAEKDLGSGWQAAEDGDRLQCEHGLRTGEDSWAIIEFTAGGVFRLTDTTQINLSCKGRPGLSVALGEVLIESRDDELVLDLEIGTVRLSRGGSYRLGQGRFDIQVGAAQVQRKGQEAESLAEGEGLEWDIGAVTVSRSQPTEPAAVQDAGPVDAAVDAAVEYATTFQTKASGRKVQLRAPGDDGWKRLKAGEHALESGTLVRLGKRSKLRLERDGQETTLEGPGEFELGGPGGQMVSAKRGKMTVHATDAPVRIAVPGGIIVAKSRPGDGSRASIDVGKRSTRVRATAGATDVAGQGGASETLRIGERVTLARDGALEVSGRAPEHADFTMPAGETASVHDPRPPTAIRIDFGEQCAGEGIVEVSPRSRFRSRISTTSGTGGANLSAKKGTHYYRVRCIEDGVLQKKASARGKLRVLSDNATRPLPRRASESVVDADGRRYSVLYQNRLPAITFRWPKASKSGSYRFHLQKGKGKTTTRTLSQPSYKSGAGKLAEGTYRYSFEAGARRSKTSTLSIAFDNEAPSTHLSAPRVSQSWSASGKVSVQGAALKGSKVSVGSTAIPLDSHGRFSTRVELETGQKTMAVRVAHRKQGVHYYIRRSR